MTTFKEHYEQRVESDRLAAQWNSYSFRYKFIGCNYLEIDSIRETNTKITIAVKEHWIKNPKRIAIEKLMVNSYLTHKTISVHLTLQQITITS